MAIDARKNFCKSTFEGASGIDADDTSLTVADASNFPDPASGNYNLVIWNITDYANPSDAFANSAAEIVRATALSTNTFTITREQESTTGRAFNTAGKTYAVAMTLTAKTVTDIETDLAAKANDADVVHDTGAETIAGVKTFSSDPIIPDEAYGAGWNGSLEPPTKNAVYDKIETLGGGGMWTRVTSGTFTADTSLTGLDLHAAQQYKLIVQYEATDAPGNRKIGLTFNSDTTAIYYNTQKILYDTGAATGEENIISTLSLFSITCGGANVTSTNGGFAEIDIIKMDATNYTSVKWVGNAYDHGDARKRSYTTGGGTYASTTNVTSIQIDSVVSTMDSGRYWLYKLSTTV